MTSPGASVCLKRPSTGSERPVAVLRSRTRRSTSARKSGSSGHSRSRKERSSFNDRSTVESTSVEMRRNRSSSMGSSVERDFWRTAIQLYQRLTQPELTAQSPGRQTGRMLLEMAQVVPGFRLPDGLEPRFQGSHFPRHVQQSRVELDERSLDRSVLGVALHAA